MNDQTGTDEPATYLYSYELSRLETIYSRVSDGLLPMSAFTKLVNEIDWQTVSPEVFVKAISCAFTLEASRLTHRLSELGHQRFPDHQELAKLAELFAPPRIIQTNLPPVPSLSASMQWIQKQSHNYEGYWVAVLAGELVDKDTTRQGLVEKLGDLSSNAELLITRIP